MSMPDFEFQGFPRTDAISTDYSATPRAPSVTESAADANDSNKHAAEEIRQSAAVRRSGGLHRIRAVRREQGVSIKRAAQLMGKSVDDLRAEEQEASDLTLTRLYEWQRLLEVPIEDLLVEPHAPLSEPVLKRARMVRLMKTVQAIMERTGQPSIRRLAQTMINQLIEIMPELEGVTPWNSLERRKSRNQNSRILESTYLNPPTDVPSSQ